MVASSIRMYLSLAAAVVNAALAAQCIAVALGVTCLGAPAYEMLATCCLTSMWYFIGGALKEFKNG